MAFTNITLAQLRTYVAARLQNPNFWSATEVQWAINQAIRDWNLATGYFQGRFIVTTVVGRVLYNLQTLSQLQVGGVSQLTMPLRVAFNGQPLDPTSTDDLDNGYPSIVGWQLTTTATAGMPSTPQLWAPIGLSYIALYPADAIGNNSLQIDGVIRAPILTSEGAYINLDSSLISAFIGEIICTISVKRGGVALQKAQAGHAEFMRAAIALNSHLKAVAPFRGYAGIDRSRSTRRRDTVQSIGAGFR